jgi:hypothetical protein
MKVTALILTAANLLTFACSTPAATTSQSPAVTAAATPTTTSGGASATATASPTTRAGFATYESPILGYRITMPDPYRRLIFVVNSGSAETLGSEMYTRRTELEERELCLRQGELPQREWETDVVILTYRNADNVSAALFANTPRVSGGQAFSANRTIEPVNVDGRDAVRLVWEPTKGGETAGYVIPANGRMYVLMPALASLPSQLPKGWLDEIATSFRAVTPQPAPAPTPSAAPTPRCGV